MIAMTLVGAAVGAVLFVVVLRLAPPRVAALVQLGRLDAQYQAAGCGLAVSSSGSQNARAGANATAAQSRLGRLVAAEFARRGISHTSLRQDLALTGRDLEDVMGRKVISAVAGLLLALLAMVGLQVTSGLPLPPGTPIAAALVVAAGFFFLPDLEARHQAAGRRRDFRRAFGAYLDLVALEMAGSAAPAQALTSAARVGAGWPMALLRDTLFRATRSGNDQWAALTDLGVRIGVAELRDLGALVRLVERDGARVRMTLSARAATMRRRELADAQGQAAERDQSMRLAQVVIGFGFVVFLMYPAIVNVTNF
jgi:tight adherence protein C